MVDHIPDAGTLNVVEGDFFGTGAFPAKGTGSLLVPHRWSIEPVH
jgi:hypothetical protein